MTASKHDVRPRLTAGDHAMLRSMAVGSEVEGEAAVAVPAPVPAPPLRDATATQATGARGADDTAGSAWAVAAAVPDPELPSVTVEDLGILRGITVEADGVVVAHVTPTYSGCPAVPIIERDIAHALQQAGFRARIERVASPPWTTAWITPRGRARLRANGIAPPAQASTSKRALFAAAQVACPRCAATQTTRVSEFGSTACKAMYRCERCREPFEYFKCL